MIFRLQVTLQDGKRYAGVGFFLSNGEAIEQTWADYPEASSISAICIGKGAPA